MNDAIVSCLRLFSQAAACPLLWALDKAGKSIADRIAMMAMTTSANTYTGNTTISNSINVKAVVLTGFSVCVIFICF